MKTPFLLGALSALFFASLPPTVLSAGAITSGDTSTSTGAANTTLIAKQITQASALKLIRTGPDAIGGIDDWFVSNGTLCAIVSDVEHEGEFSPRGGALVDLGFCGRDDDYFTATYDLLQGSQNRPLLADQIRAEIVNGNANIIVQSSQEGGELETTYSLNAQTPSQLHIRKRLRPTNGESFNFFSTINFNLHSLEPFILNSKDLELSNGFAQEDFVERGLSAISDAARYADILITPSPADAPTGISYGWQMASANKIDGEHSHPVPTYLLADEWSNASLVLADDFLLGSEKRLGWLQLAQMPLMGLDSDEILETHEIIHVGKSGSVSSITDALFAERDDAVLIEGKSTALSAIHIRTSSGAPVSHVRTQANGQFKLWLPRGTYTAKAVSSAGREQTQSFDTAKGQPLLFDLPKVARLNLPTDEAMRLVFVGLGDTPDPDFSSTFTGFSVKDDDGSRTKDPINQVFLAGAPGDKTFVELPAGNYLVYATRGPEYSLSKAEVELSNGETKDLKIDLPKHINATPGYIAADLHVHSGFSFDNAFAERERVRTFAAEHGEIMVASEHDVAVDYQPIIEAMGVQDKLISISGIEATSLLTTKQNPYTNGHANFFPFTPSPLAYRRGALAHEDRRWRDVLATLREAQPDALAQLNHPRRDLTLSAEQLPSDWEDIVENGHFLDHMGSAAHPFNPHKDLHTHPNKVLIEAHPETGVRDIDFDLIEVVNPGTNYMERTEAVRRDWLSLLKQGERLVATANSDSHHANEQVAVPRNMVALSDDRLEGFNLNPFINALKNGNSYGTTGPMLEIKLGDNTMGEMFDGQRGNLWVQISKVPWFELSHIDIQIDGQNVDRLDLNQQTQQEVLLPLSFEKDAFVTVEVHGKASEDYQAVYPGLVPYAFSNPIYVDFDGDGNWSPPGL